MDRKEHYKKRALELCIGIPAIILVFIWGAVTWCAQKIMGAFRW